MEKIEDSAFYNCRKLRNVEIPNSVVYIGENAFSNSGLTEIDIPDSVVMNEKQVKLISEINGKNAAQIMLVVGTDEGEQPRGMAGQFYRGGASSEQNKRNVPHPCKADLPSHRFLQSGFVPGALLIEFGSSGNTMEEAIEAAKLTAEAMAEALK